MKYVKGDCLSVYQSEWIVHCISADAVLGMGFAKKLVSMDYGLKQLLMQNIPTDGYTVGTILVDNRRKVVHLVTKKKFHDKPTYSNIFKTLDKLGDWCRTNSIEAIHMPRIASGLDKKNWDVIAKRLNVVFSHCSTKITVYVI